MFLQHTVVKQTSKLNGLKQNQFITCHNYVDQVTLLGNFCVICSVIRIQWHGCISLAFSWGWNRKVTSPLPGPFLMWSLEQENTDFSTYWGASQRAKAKAARSLKAQAQQRYNIKSFIQGEEKWAPFLDGHKDVFVKEERSWWWPSLKAMYHSKKKPVTKSRRKQNNLESRSRLTGDLDAGDFRKRLECLKIVMSKRW